MTSPEISSAVRFAPWMAFFSALVLIVIVSGRPQGLHFYDQSLQSIALRQWSEGRSRNPNVLVRVDPTNASRDVTEWLSWWPPSLQLLAAPMVGRGLSLGTALRAVFAVSALAGAVGWALWMRKFGLPGLWIVVLAACLPWLRHMSENAFRYSAETLSFALAPWLMLLIAKLPPMIAGGGASTLFKLLLAGLALGAAYLAKYSLFVFISAGVGFVAWETRNCWWDGPRRARSRISFGVLAIGLVTAPLALRLANRQFHGTDPVSFGTLHFDSATIWFAIANPALALADAQGPLFHAFIFPGWLHHRLDGIIPVAANPLLWIGVPGGVLLAVLLFRNWRTAGTSAPFLGRLAVATLALNTLVVALLWQFADVDHMARHFAPAAMCALPVALGQGRAEWQRARRAARIGLAIAGTVFVAAPLAYGFAYVMAKCAAVPRDYQAGVSGLLLPTLSDRDAAGVAAALRRHWTHDSIWIVGDPEMALELPGRFMLAYGDRDVGHELQRLARGPWRQPGDLATSAPERLLLLLPKRGNPSAQDAEAHALAGKIAKSSDWRRADLPPGANCVLWTGLLSP